MKCVKEVEAVENSLTHSHAVDGKHDDETRHRIIILGGLSGRLDQTIHTLSYVQKLTSGVVRRHHSSPNEASGGKQRDVRVVSEDCVAWVLEAGHHEIHVDHSVFGQTCGILPLGVESAYVKTTGLKWNLDWTTSFDTEISTSNHLLPEEPVVTLETDRPVWWTMEIRSSLS